MQRNLGPGIIMDHFPIRGIEMTFLPYHCPTFKTDHLMKPCQKNLARVKVLKEAKKHVGPLEVCVDCRGKMLITKPPKPYLQDWNPNPEVTTAPLFLKDVGKKEPEMR